jgi:hypothetical protein
MAPTASKDREIRRTTVDLDIEELERAKETLGTATTRATIDAALRHVNRRAALARAAAAIASGDLDIVGPEELAALRRARVGT